jgi:hypothetical protein
VYRAAGAEAEVVSCSEPIPLICRTIRDIRPRCTNDQDAQRQNPKILRID